MSDIHDCSMQAANHMAELVLERALQERLRLLKCKNPFPGKQGKIVYCLKAARAGAAADFNF